MPVTTATPPVAAATQPHATPVLIEAPLLWRATKADQTVFLLGTIHMGVGADELPARVWDAFASSKHVAVEANVNDPSLIAGMMRVDKGSLQAELGPVAWAKLVAVLGESEAKAMERFKPFVVAMMLQTQGLPPTPGIDVGVMERANAQQKPLAYLEAGALQLRLLEKWMSVKALIAMLDHLDEMKQQNADLISTYRKGDEAAIIAMSGDDQEAAMMGLTPAEAKQMEFELLEQRNQSWIAPIEELAADGPVFIAVGAMHLIGDKSVNALLRARGWKVERQ